MISLSQSPQNTFWNNEEKKTNPESSMAEMDCRNLCIIFGLVQGLISECYNYVKTKYEIENAQNLIWSTNLLLTTKGILAWQSFTRFVFDFFGCSVYIPLTIVECRKCALRAHSLHPTIVLGCKHYSLKKTKQILFTLTS